MKSTRLATLCVALGLAAFFNSGGHAQFIIVDGTRDSSYGTPLAVQSVTSGWGNNNVLASISAKQEGGSLKVFLAGRPDGNVFLLFIDSKSGGSNVITTNTIASGGEEYVINNLGTSSSAGMTFETGFSPDYAIRIHGEGWTALYPLAQGSSRSYLGQSTVGTVSGGPVTALRTVYNNVTGNYADHTTGVEIDLSLAGLGVPTGTGQSVKFMAILINQGSDFASNQTLGSLPAGSGDLGNRAALGALNFDTVSGAQTISMTVDNTDADGDGISDATDPDDDNDGLNDTVETNTGTFVDENNTGSNPLVADTDGDGMNDGAEVAAGRDPNKYNYAQITIAGGFQGWSAGPTPTNAPVNVMTAVPAGSLNYELLWRFASATNTEGKFTAGGWSINWGASATPGIANLGSENNIPFNVTASGVWKFAFNTDTRAYSFARVAKPGTYDEWAAQYGLAAGSGADDTDSDFLTNSQEFSADSDPTNSDTDGDGLFDDEEVTGDYAEVIPTVPSELNGKALSPITNDTDGDGLPDFWEITNGLDATDNGSVVSYVNATGLTVTANPNGASGDPDNDGLTNAQELAANSNPRAAGTGFASVYPKITVPGSFNGYNAGGDAANTMQLVGNFTWNLIVYFSSAPVSPVYKFAAGSWSTNWGDGNPPDGTANANGGDISGASVFTAAGYYLITFNDNTLAYSASAVTATDADNDGLPDEWEAYYGSFLDPKTTNLVPTTAYVTGGLTAAEAYAAGVNPVADTVAPSIALASGVDKVTWVATGTSVTLANADVTATDAITTSPTVSFLPATVDTAVDGLTTVTYTATDAAGNASTVTRVIAVGAAAPGYRNLRFPATMTINTSSSDYAYGEIFVDGATAGAGAATGITAWVGVNTNDTDPATWTNSIWSQANYVGEEGNNDNYQGVISGTGRAPGTYYYATRFQLGTNSTNYFYGGITTNGVGNAWGSVTDTNGVTTTYGNGVLTVLASRQVTYAVDMSVQIFKGAFDPATNGVEVRGDFNGFSGGAALVRDGTSTIYTNTFAVGGAEGSTNKFKFYTVGTNAVGFEGGADREAVLTADAVPLNTGTNFFSGVSESRKITFRVDMSVQAAKGNFNTNSGVVQVAGSFNGWSTTATPLSAQGNGVYAAEVTVDGPVSGISYKFLKGTTAGDYEVVPDRTISTVLPNLAASTLDVVLFGNDDGVAPTDISLSASSIAENNAVNAVVGTLSSTDASAGDTHTYSLVAGTGDTDNASFNISGSDLRAGVAFDFETKASYSIRVRSTDSKGNSFEKAFTVSVTDVAEGSSFAGAYPGKNLTDVAPNGLTYLVNYAFGGSDTTAATLPVQDTSDPTKLKLIVVVRTDDSSVTVGGQASTSLTGGWSSTGVTVADGDNTGLPADRARKVISVDRGTDPRKFLRVSVTK